MSNERTVYKAEIELGTIPYTSKRAKNPVILEVKIEEKETCYPHLDIDLQPCRFAKRVSISAGVWRPDRTDDYAFGQIRELILEHFGDDPKIRRLCEIWNRRHLNDLQAGTREQRDAIEAAKAEGWKPSAGRYGPDHYGSACALLKELDLYKAGSWTPNGKTEPEPYKYGHAWLCETVPEETIEELIALCESLKR